MNEVFFIEEIRKKYIQKSGFIGISGLSGSGKTTLAKKLCDIFPERALVIPLDDFCIVPTAKRKSYLLDVLASGDKERLKYLSKPDNEEDNPYANPLSWYDWKSIANTLKQLRNGQTVVRKNAWNQATGLCDKVVVYRPPRYEYPLYFLECVYMHQPEVKPLISEIALIESSTKLSNQRRELRDNHRNDPTYSYYKDLVTDIYCIPYLNKHRQYVDYIIDNN